MIAWIKKPLILAIHDRQLAEHGGSPGVRDASVLESALARPLQLDAYGDPPPDVADLAAALALGLARNHPFIDGNKRTAHVAYRVFLELNGWELVASDEEKYVAMIALAEGKLAEHGFAAWIRSHIRNADGSALHEKRAPYRMGRRNRCSPRSAVSMPRDTTVRSPLAK